ncbi:MAG: cupredoxin family copper-binding protein [Vulcanimicrobiaceae bacterium]
MEIFLTLVAAISGSLAAVGAFMGASYEKARVDLERRPAIHLSCRPEFAPLDTAEHDPPPTQTLLLTSRGAQWVHNMGPTPFARCAVTNYGHLPVLDVRIPFGLSFGSNASPQPVETVVDIPGLAADASFAFGLLNSTHSRLTYRFGRTVDLARVDLDAPTKERLFADDGVAELEARGVDPPSPDSGGASPAPKRVDIVNFAYRPGELRVAAGTTVTFLNRDGEPHTITALDRTFDSEALDGKATWSHRFRKPGRYAFLCGFHPYMRGIIVVTGVSK